MQLTADTILGLEARQARQVFDGDVAQIKARFRRLAAAWHPDHSDAPQAADVFARLVELRDAALKGQGAAARQRHAGAREAFVDADGRQFALRHVARRQTDTGMLYVGPHSLVQVFDPELEDIAAAEEARLAGFSFADRAMEDQMRLFLPDPRNRRDLADGRIMTIQARKPGEILLADLLQGDGAMPPVHAAWLCSGLMNIAAWLSWSETVHGAIGPETVLVEPETHAVRLAGGWGFATAAGTRPSMLPARSLQVVPRLAVQGTTADVSLDLELVRHTVREAIGAPTAGLLARIDLPDPVRDWLVMPPAGDGIADYAAWQDALGRGWGKRRFSVYAGAGAALYASQ